MRPFQANFEGTERFQIKDRLGIGTLRMVGDPDMICQCAAILVGAWGGRNHINFWRQTGVDVLIVGEIDEWETSEYTRDAVIQGRKRGLIITGHAYVHPCGQAGPWQLGAHNDMMSGGLKKMAAAVHAAGGRICLQLAHAGGHAAAADARDQCLDPAIFGRRVQETEASRMR